MYCNKIFLGIICFAALTTAAIGQTNATMPVAPPQPEARPADVSTLDGIIAALYDVISGPPEKKRDFDRMRSLFSPGAQMMAISPKRNGVRRFRPFSVDFYIERSAPLFAKSGFFEHEIGRHTDQYANLYQVFSSYESRFKTDDAKPFERGINSLQLVFDGKRFWITSILWQGEDSSHTPIPKRYLGRSGVR
jgi:hypothetical protein